MLHAFVLLLLATGMRERRLGWAELIARGLHERRLHLVSENPSDRNEGYTNRRLHGTPSCDKPLRQHLTNQSVLPAHLEIPVANGRALRASRRSASTDTKDTPTIANFWRLFGRTHRLNFGSMFGTRDAMMDLCEQVVAVLVGPMALCWDQGMLNILVWTGLLTGHAKQAMRVVIWDCFEGPIKTLDVGGLRDANGRFYNELGALYPIVHQFRKTRHSAFYASLEKVLPTRAAKTGPTAPSPLLLADSVYPSFSWNSRLYEQPLQRVPFIWDDKRRMAKLKATMVTSGLPDPADATRPLPTPVSPCAPPIDQFRPCAEQFENGTVQGSAWEALATGGFVRAGTDIVIVQDASQRQPREQGGAQLSRHASQSMMTRHSHKLPGAGQQHGSRNGARTGARPEAKAEIVDEGKLTRHAYRVLETELARLSSKVKDHSKQASEQDPPNPQWTVLTEDTADVDWHRSSHVQAPAADGIAL